MFRGIFIAVTMTELIMIKRYFSILLL